MNDIPKLTLGWAMGRSPRSTISWWCINKLYRLKYLQQIFTLLKISGEGSTPGARHAYSLGMRILRNGVDLGVACGMICDRFGECANFLNYYRRIGREEIADHYTTHYCHNKNNLICKRKEHFNINRKMPDIDLTPSGHRSMLIRLFK